MDSTFFLTVVAAEIGFFKLFGAAMIFFKLLGALLFMIFRKFRYQYHASSFPSSSPPPSLCSSSLSSSTPTSSSSPPSSLCSSSSFSCKWTHDVFPSFRGEDVRKNFLSHIQKEFRRKGIIPFIDNDIKRGESIGPELVQAIKRSKVAVVLISKNYASSKWCLDELVEIMECKEKSGQMVFAIFYEVDPSHVKKLTGDFGAVFQKTCAGKRNEDVARWRQALAKVATIAGYDSRNWDNEAVMIEEIVTEISRRLISSTPSRYLEGLIGMGAHMEKMEQLLCLGSDEVRMVGIWGPPGIGKTTIARALHSQISDVFQLSVFITFKPSYARQPCSDDHDERLQLEQRFLSELLNRKDLEIPDLGAARNFLMHKKVLVIFDGVEQLVQLDVMPEAQCLGLGSRIIITTQNLRMLNAFEIEHIYQVNLPPAAEALQIFCMSAFGQSSPKDGFVARVVTRLVGWLPLGLKVMGSHFRGIRSKQEWKAELPRLRVVCLEKKIGSILKFSYDALEEEDKDLFLYIACFFGHVNLDDDTFEDVLRHRFSNVRQGLHVLFQRSLVSMEMEHYYSMHGLLVQLGREIVRNKSIDKPGKRQFLVDAKEICEVLSDNIGSRSVIGINLNISTMKDDQDISERAFEKMTSLQLLRFDYKFCHWLKLHFPQGLKSLPPKLRKLHWDYYPMTSLPSNFNPKFLVELELKYSKLEKLWDGIQLLGNLKFMDLRYSTNLKELPDISFATNLQGLSLSGCSSLVKIPTSIGNLQMLKWLSLWRCSKLQVLPRNINLGSLEELDVSGCSQLRNFPEISTNIEKLSLCGTLIEEVPLSVESWSRFQELEITYFKNLGEFPNVLNLITVLELNNTEIEEFPPWFSGISRLRGLILKKCRKLVSIPQLPDCMESIDAENCDSLERLACSYPNPIYSLRFINCWKLNEKARNNIAQSAGIGTAILAGREVPACFTYRSTSGGSVKANLGGVNSWRLKACISLVCKGDKGARDDQHPYVNFKVVDKQIGLDTVIIKSKRRLDLLLTEHLYAFNIWVDNVKTGELFFEFEFKCEKWEIAQCGIREL